MEASDILSEIYEQENIIEILCNRIEMLENLQAEIDILEGKYKKYSKQLAFLYEYSYNRIYYEDDEIKDCDQQIDELEFKLNVVLENMKSSKFQNFNINDLSELKKQLNEELLKYKFLQDDYKKL